MNRGRIRFGPNFVEVALRLPVDTRIIALEHESDGGITLIVDAPFLLPTNDRTSFIPTYAIEITKDVPRWTFKNKVGEIVAANIPSRI